MNFRIYSDLHFEFHRDNGGSLLDDIPHGQDGETVILAGDIFVGERLIHETLLWFSDNFETVIFVAGNHEYYHTKAQDHHEILKHHCSRFSNVIFLDCEVINLHGLTIYGGSMWFENSLDNPFFSLNMSDFSVIDGFVPWVYQENERFRAELSRIDYVDLVISHHLPSHQCTPERFKGGDLNRFFVCDMESEILRLQPKAWVYGHTHSPDEFLIGETKLICNPYGYPGENLQHYDFECTVVL